MEWVVWTVYIPKLSLSYSRYQFTYKYISKQSKVIINCLNSWLIY